MGANAASALPVLSAIAKDDTDERVRRKATEGMRADRTSGFGVPATKKQGQESKSLTMTLRRRHPGQTDESGKLAHDYRNRRLSPAAVAEFEGCHNADYGC
jgi:hypothetical protein